jgi:hypothetical protein
MGVLFDFQVCLVCLQILLAYRANRVLPLNSTREDAEKLLINPANAV